MSKDRLHYVMEFHQDRYRPCTRLNIWTDAKDVEVVRSILGACTAASDGEGHRKRRSR